MKYKIELTENWRPERHSFYTPGVYRVPADLSEAMAEQAMSEGVAKRLEVLKPKPTFPGPKAISAAPENKAKVVAWPGRGGGNGSVPDAGSGGGGFGRKGSRGK